MAIEKVSGPAKVNARTSHLTERKSAASEYAHPTAFRRGCTSGWCSQPVDSGSRFGRRGLLAQGWSAMPNLKKDPELIQRGPYRLVRHPIYTGLLLAVFGTCLAGGRRWNLCLVGMAAILLIVKLKAKEALLTRQFPERIRN